jgi:hypothetical protein
MTKLAAEVNECYSQNCTNQGLKMKLKDVTTLQWLGIIILFNTTLLGGASQLGDLSLTPGVIKAILAVATLGNGFLGGLVTMFGGMQAQKDAVGATGAVVITSTASAEALPNNPNVIAANPAIMRALKAAQ